MPGSWEGPTDSLPSHQNTSIPRVLNDPHYWSYFKQHSVNTKTTLELYEVFCFSCIYENKLHLTQQTRHIFCVLAEGGGTVVSESSNFLNVTFWPDPHSTDNAQLNPSPPRIHCKYFNIFVCVLGSLETRHRHKMLDYAWLPSYGTVGTCNTLYVVQTTFNIRRQG